NQISSPGRFLPRSPILAAHPSVFVRVTLLGIRTRRRVPSICGFSSAATARAVAKSHALSRRFWAFISNVPRKRPVQQRLLQLVQCGELAAAYGFEALRPGRTPIQKGYKSFLIGKRRYHHSDLPYAFHAYRWLGGTINKSIHLFFRVRTIQKVIQKKWINL